MAQLVTTKAFFAVTAQVGPVYKGNLNKGTNGVPTRNGAGDYTCPLDSLSSVTLLSASGATDMPVLSLLSNAVNINGGITVPAGNQTVRAATAVAGVATDIDFGLFILSAT